MKTTEELQKEFNEAQKIFDKASKALSVRIKKESSSELDILFKDGITVESVMKVDSLFSPEYDGGKYYKEVQNFLGAFYNSGIYYGGNYFTSENTQKSQIALKVIFDQNKPFDEQLGILEFIPYLLPVNGRDYKTKLYDKCIGVFEESLSEGGVYQIVYIEKDKIWKLIITTYGREQSLITNKDIKEVLHHVYLYHPYEPKNKE